MGSGDKRQGSEIARARKLLTAREEDDRRQIEDRAG
jgi:hypothetical protein